MKTLQLVQGTPEWIAARARYRTASEASVMMGCSKKATRGELVRMKATGTEQEFSRWVEEVLFARGHEIEALARPIAERIIGEDLYPATATDDKGYLLASFDGITMLEDVVWECKQWNESKATEVRAGVVPEEDRWQVVQQLTVSGASSCLYMVTDGTEERTVCTVATLQDGEAAALIAGWRQFDADVASYTHVEVAPAPEAAPVAALPAIRYQLNGLALTSNLKEFRAAAEQLVEQSKQALETDQDFADAEKRVKAFKEAEERIGLVSEQVIGEIRDVDQFCRELGGIGELIRQARLNSEKQVDARKKAIRAEVKQAAERALSKHIGDLERALEAEGGYPVSLRAIVDRADFAGAIKNKRTITSLRDSVDQVVANAKIDAAALAERIRANFVTLRDLGGGYPFLFADGSQLVMKDPADLAELIKARVANHEAAEAARLDAQREQIRQEEQQRIARENTEKQSHVDPAPVEKLPPLDAYHGEQEGTADLGDADVGTVWLAQVFEPMALVKAIAAGEQPVSLIREWDMPMLNAQARRLKDEMSVPGVRAISKRGIASR